MRCPDDLLIMTSNIARAPTTYQRFKRLLCLVAVVWYGYWAAVLGSNYFSEQHRQLRMYAGEGKVNFAWRTFANGGRDDAYGKDVESRMIDGERYEFFFSSDESDIKKMASAWTSDMNRRDMELAKRITMESRRTALKEKAPLVLGASFAFFAAWLLGYYLLGALRPRSRFQT
jgi:hypothetical protein